MSRPTSARWIATDDQILATLRDAGAPRTTQEICDTFGVHRYREGMQLYRRLHAMAMAGRVERWRLDGVQSVSWGLPAGGAR